MIANKIKIGSTIGLISPAGPENPESIKSGIDFLKGLGFNIKEGKHIYDRWGFLAGSDKDRAYDLMSMFMDDEVDMILCIRGGYGTMRILPLIDFDIIKTHPKVFAGFSDITTILNSIFQRCDLITFHSPMCTSNFEDKITLESFINTLTQGDLPYCIKNPKEMKLICSNTGNASGRLIGGNLTLICSTLGTPYEIDTTDNILLIEDVGVDPYEIDRMLTQLLLSGKLQVCSGLIVGQFTNCNLEHYERSLTIDEIVEDRILNLGIPTFLNLATGHSYPKLTLPIGAKVNLNFNNNSIDILESVVLSND